MKTLIVITLVVLGAVLLLAQSLTPVQLTDGQSVTVSCSAQQTCPIPAPVPSGHEDHYARHRDVARQKGSAYCRTCHVAGGTAVTHGPRTFVSASTFRGPQACYTAPWGAPGFPATDPFGTEVYPAQVCAPNTAAPHQAVFASGTLVQCAYCHSDN